MLTLQFSVSVTMNYHNSKQGNMRDMVGCYLSDAQIPDSVTGRLNLNSIRIRLLFWKPKDSSVMSIFQVVIVENTKPHCF